MILLSFSWRERSQPGTGAGAQKLLMEPAAPVNAELLKPTLVRSGSPIPDTPG